jgi:hypothetical protein
LVAGWRRGSRYQRTTCDLFCAFSRFWWPTDFAGDVRLGNCRKKHKEAQKEMLDGDDSHLVDDSNDLDRSDAVVTLWRYE